MEQQIKISLANKKYIYGTLRDSLKQPMVIFVHGFTGHKDEHIFFNGARNLEEQGFSSFRFNLYHWEKDSRKLEECTLSLHGEDLDTVVKYFRKKGVKRIFVVGHSFGGLTVLLSKDQDFDGIALWDSSINPAEINSAKFIKELDKYYLEGDDSYGFTIGKDMFEENKALKPFELIKIVNAPIKIIVAGAGALIEGGKKYFQLSKEPKAFAIIPKATHNFNEDGTEERLFKETYAWFNKFK